MTFTKEQMRKAMECRTVDELLAMAKSEGVELSREQAEEYIAQLGERKLTDDELAQVVGGMLGDDGCVKVACDYTCTNDKMK